MKTESNSMTAGLVLRGPVSNSEKMLLKAFSRLKRGPIGRLGLLKEFKGIIRGHDSRRSRRLEIDSVCL